MEKNIPPLLLDKAAALIGATLTDRIGDDPYDSAAIAEACQHACTSRRMLYYAYDHNVIRYRKQRNPTPNYSVSLKEGESVSISHESKSA